MIHKFVKKYTLPVILFVMMVIPGSMAVFASDTTLNPNVEFWSIVRVGVTYLLMLACFAMLMMRSINNDQLQFMGIAFLWWFICTFHVAPGDEHSLNILAFLLLLAYSYFKPDERQKAFELYRYYIILMCAGGIVAYLMFLAGLPAKVVPYYAGEEIQRHVFVWGYYYNYYLGFIWGLGGFGRLCGWFNEPGYLGTIASLILIAQNFNLKRKGNIIILVATVFTFSLAALVILTGYLLTMALRNGKMVVALICFLLAVTIIVPIAFKDNETYEKFTQRLEYKNGEFAGDNRATHKIFRRLRNRQDNETIPFLFGYGTGALEKQGNLNICGIEVQFYLYGVVGILLTYGLLFLYAWKYTKGSYQAKAFVIWFFLSTYQRPFIFAGDYIIILFGGLAYIQAHSENMKQLAKEKFLKRLRLKKMKEEKKKRDMLLDI